MERGGARPEEGVLLIEQTSSGFERHVIGCEAESSAIGLIEIKPVEKF